MIGQDAFFIENNEIRKAKIVAQKLQHNEIICILECGREYKQKDICLTIEELFKKLYKDYAQANFEKVMA